MNRAAATSMVVNSEEPSPTTKASSFGLRNMLPGSSWSAKKREAVQSRRKPSVSDVDLSPMTTLQEISLDSRRYSEYNRSTGSQVTATIPGHLPGRPLHPGIERSLSVPDHVLHRLSEEVNDQTPRASEFPVLQDVAITPFSAQADIASNESEKRCTLLVPKDLKPLIIPKVAEPMDEIVVPAELPPEVPPKSPRTESRASPRIKKGLHSANSSVSTLRSATSSSSSHSFKDNRSTRSLQTPNRNEIPPSHLRGMENVVSTTTSPNRTHDSPSHPHSPENMKPMTPMTSWTRTGRSQSPSLSSAPLSRKQSRSPTKLNDEKAVLSSNVPASHQRGRSEPLFLEQDQPPFHERRDTSSIHGLLWSIDNVPEYYSESFDLPSGFRAVDATSKLSGIEVKSLKKQAVRHAERFEVLQSKDVSMLSEELELLEERCEYLQSTHKSLRQGRRNLHSRMITYLRSPRMANFSRESILKQEEALAELDISIDEWLAKLEDAEERRTTVRQKLLQHVAAALTLQTVGVTRPLNLEEATPPVSPEKTEDYFSSKRKDVQSIRIYADEGVAALLTEIEREIGFIAEPSKLI